MIPPPSYCGAAGRLKRTGNGLGPQVLVMSGTAVSVGLITVGLSACE